LLDCPVCSDALAQELIHGVTVDVCPTHGLWLDRGELMLITEGERHDVGRFSLADLLREAIQPPVNTDRVLSCPQCSEKMGLERYQEVHLDRCIAHGIWLDAGELKALLSNLRLDPLYRRGASIRLWEARF
jgi:Zn-finger nucleic acid-binding protein